MILTDTETPAQDIAIPTAKLEFQMGKWGKTVIRGKPSLLVYV